MLLASRALAFVQEVNSYKRKQEIAGEAEKFSARAKQLKLPSERLAALQDLADEMGSNGVAPVLPTSLVVATAEQANKHLMEFENDAKKFVEPNVGLAQEFLSLLTKLESEYKESIRQAWGRHVEVLVKPLPDALLRAIETLPTYQAQVTSLRTKHADAEKLTKEVPRSGHVESVLKQITRLNEENDATWAELNGSGLPEDVVDFLRKSGGMGGAPLSEVTPSILNWLQGRNLLTSFCVRVR